MKKLKLFFALFAMLALGVGNAWGAEATVYTSNVELSTTGGTKATDAKAKISDVEYSAMKLGSSGNAGNFYVNLPANTTSLTLHAAAWNGKNSNKLTLSSETAGVTISPSTAQTLTANSGVSGNSTTYTITPNNTKEFFTFTLTGATSGAKIKLACTERCLIWGVNAETTGGGENPGEGGGENPDSGEETSATMTAGTNGTACTVNGKAGIKVGTSSKGGDMKITVPAGATMLHVYAAAWKGVTNLSLNITPTSNVTTTSIALQANDGIANSTPFTLSGNEADYLFDIPLQNITAETTLTFTSSTTKRFVVWGATYETAGSDEPGTEEPVPSLTQEQFSWSATTATATLPNTFDNPPTLTNTESLAVSYSSSKGEVATIDENGNVTLVGKGETIISATAGDDETYKKTTVSYTLTVKPAPLAPIAGGVIDILNQDWTDVTGTNYTDVAAKTAENEGHSNAQYVAQCAGDKSSIQLRSNNNNSGVVSTISGGIVKRVEVEWQNETTAGRILQVYGSNTAYEAATDLYSDDKKGELLGEITMGGDETVVDYSQWTGDYKYIGLRSKSGAMYLTTITITWLPINSKVTIDGAIQNGYVSVSGATDLNAVAAGTELTLSNTPATNYKLTAYNVYKTGEESTKVTVADDNTFIMPEFDVTISATFEAAKTLNSIEITTSATQTTFWQGETFNYTGLEVTAHFDGAADEDVTDKVTVTGSTATSGTQTVTVSYNEGATTKTATYNITVKAIPNTQETAYTVADAYDIIDKLTTAEGVFIKGIVSQVDEYLSSYKSITYWISADGTTTNQLQVYSGKGLESADFDAVTDLTVGDKVIVCGKLKKYSGTYEFDKNNYLASHTPTTKDPAGLAYATTSYTANVGETFTTPELTNPHNLVVTYSTSDASKATVDANTGAVTIVAAGMVTITAATTGDATHDAGSASYTITISNPAMAVATLPFAFDNGKADIENTPGMSQDGLGSDYTSAGSPKLKFDHTGDYVIIHFNGEPGKLSYDIKGNSYSGSTFTVQESENGETYTDIVAYTELSDKATKTHTLTATSRYVKFIYTEKVNGNVALGNIKIALPEEEPEQPGGGEGTEQPLTDWVLTSAADITINDLVVITMTKDETTWAMTNDNGTSAPTASAVTLSANALASQPAENLKWVIANESGNITIYPYGGYESWLYCTNTNNGVKVGNNDSKIFTIDAESGYLKHEGTSRFIGVYNAQDWRCYTNTTGNTADQTLAFFVKKNANDILPGTGEDPEEPGDDPVVPTPTINPTATFIFNTPEGLTDLGITYPATADEDNAGAYKTEFENNATFTQDGITMTTTGGTTIPTRVWLTAAGKLDLRVYKGATLTFSVPAEHQISKIVFDGSNIGHLLVNGNAVSGNAWTGSAQTITFTAKDDAKTIKINTIAFVVEYTRNVTNKYGSICLPYASASTSGAYFYEVVGKGTENSKPAVYLASVNTLKAGVPYIFEKTANTIKVVYSSEKEDTPQKANGLIGNFTNEYVVPANNYILYRNEFIPADGTTNKVNAYRAYLNLSDVDGVKPTQTMPGRRYIGMSVQGENEATGFENIFSTDAPVKVIENGQLIIIRDGVKYNVQGQKL